MIENTIMKKNREGKKANVFGLTYPSLNLVELAAHAGFDAINCDGEHGLFSPESLDDICRVANGYGMSVTARVPDKSPYWINLYLDRGIQGIVGPHVESKKEAYKIINENNEDYPLVTTKPDTSGEKEYEEFIGLGEEVLKSNFENFDVVRYSDFNIEELITFVNNFNLLLEGDISISKIDLIKNVKNIVKNLHHVETGENLDNRM